MKRASIKRSVLLIALSVIMLVMLCVMASCKSNDEPPVDDTPIDETCEHVAGEWVVEKTATCKDTGKKVKQCTKCFEQLEEEEIALSGHNAHPIISDYSPIAGHGIGIHGVLGQSIHQIRCSYKD